MSPSKRSNGRPTRKTVHFSAQRGTSSTNTADREELPLLRSVRVIDLYRIAVVWRNGGTAEVDLAPHVLRYAIYRPLRDDLDAFRKAEVIDGGVAVAWPDLDIDISADAIAALHRSQSMTAGEFRERLKRLGLSFDAAAASFDISRREDRLFLDWRQTNPPPRVLALRGFEEALGGIHRRHLFHQWM